MTNPVQEVYKDGRKRTLLTETCTTKKPAEQNPVAVVLCANQYT